MAQLCTLVAVLIVTLLTSAAPQTRPFYTGAPAYDTIGNYPTATPDYWQAQGAEPSTQGPPRDNSMVTFTTGKPNTPLGFIPSLDDAQSRFTGQVQSLPYPNFAGFPLYPFTPYAHGLWWR